MRSLNDRTKAVFRQTVSAIRARLLADLAQATDQRYSLGARDRNKIRLSPTDQGAYTLLRSCLSDPSAYQGNEEEHLAALIKERAYTLTNRLIILMQLEARGLRSVNLISQGIEQSPFRDYWGFFSGITQGDDHGYSFLLQQIWDELALELPALFAWNEIQECIPIPGPTLFWLLDMLANPELSDAWVDDTTLGWLYQYWNDPDRKAVDDKLNTTTGKVEAHELANKTQLFTERYMVEWLVQNSLGAQWLALCAKNGWKPKAVQVLENLNEKRKSWTKNDEALPIAGDEEFWKYYVEQELAPETVAAAPDRLEKVKILDPAMGSGHFLVYVFDLLWEFYQEQAVLSGTLYSDKQIIDNILGNNLHGIDIDNRAVQIATAAIYLKTQEKLPGYQIRKLNLVATDLGLGHIKKSDPSLKEFIKTLEVEAGLQKDRSLDIIESLKGAEYMGSLLQVNEEIQKISRFYGKVEGVEDAIMLALGRFIRDHDKGEDLGLRSLAEQLEKGLRLIELLGQKYDVVVANPPYCGIGKFNEKLAKEIQENYSVGKDDLFSIFMLRDISLLKDFGRTAMVTPRGWMFISQFENLRSKLIHDTRLIAFGDLQLGAFSDMKDITVTMFVLQNVKVSNGETVFVKPVPKQEIRRDQYQVSKNERGLIVQSHTYSFPQSRFSEIPGSPMIYWWPEEFRTEYLKSKKLGEISEPRQGLASSINNRFLRFPFEIELSKIEINDDFSQNQQVHVYKWQPYVKGAAGFRWFEGLSDIIIWEKSGLEVKSYASYLYGSATRTIKSQDMYFRQGLAFNSIGTNGFQCRLRKYKSIFDVVGSTIFCDDPEKMQVLLSSSISGYVCQALNPTIHNQVGDIVKLPVFDILKDYRLYLNRAKALYDKLFASTESNIEYSYQDLSPEYFEVEEARIRDEIDKEILTHFSAPTVAAIYEEIGESPFDYPEWDGVIIPEGFAEAYQASESVLALSRQFKLHPDSVLAIKDRLGLVHQGQRQARAFKHLSWAIGVLLGRFDPKTGGLVDLSPNPDMNSANLHGLLYLSGLDDFDNIQRASASNEGPACIKTLRGILVDRWGTARANEIWRQIDDALVVADGKRNLGEWIRLCAFDRHKEIYENRPIYFPLVSSRKNFFIWVNIHRWDDATLNAILANYLKPDLLILESRLRRMREDIQKEENKKRRNDLEDEVEVLDNLFDELKSFVSAITQLAEKGPAPALQEAEAPYVMDLDDGVLVNSAALRELLTPLWREPSRWWANLSVPMGKKDYDWSHLAMRYWPKRVYDKCKKDPSLAVAHSDYGAYKGRDLFKELHPVAFKKWQEQQEPSKPLGELNFEGD